MIITKPMIDNILDTDDLYYTEEIHEEDLYALVGKTPDEAVRETNKVALMNLVREYFPLSDYTIDYYCEKGAFEKQDLPYIHLSENVDESRYVYRSNYVIASHHVYDSENVRNSHDVASSTNIVGSANIQGSDVVRASKDVELSSRVVNSTKVQHSRQVSDCFDIRNCENMEHVMSARHCKNIKNSKLITLCQNSDSLFLCCGVVGKSHMVMNKPVSEEQYRELCEEFDAFGFDRLFDTSDPNPRLYKNFKQWLAALPTYDYELARHLLKVFWSGTDNG